MNFINPFTTIYFEPEELGKEIILPFQRDVIWTFLKNLDNGLKLFQHRVNIILTKDLEKVRSEKMWSIFSYYYYIEPSAFKGLDSLVQRRKLLDIIFEAFNALASEFDWDKIIIEKAYLQSIQEIAGFEYYSSSKKNKTKQFGGRIKLELNDFTLNISAEITNLLNQQYKEFKIIDVDEDKLSWERKIKDFGWFDNQRFGLKFLSGQLWIVLNVTKGIIEEIIIPKKQSTTEIEKYLKDLKRRLFSNKKL